MSVHSSGEGCQEETTLTPTGDYSTFPTKPPPERLRVRTGSTYRGGREAGSVQRGTIWYRCHPDQLPQQRSILAAAELNPTASPEASRPRSTRTGRVLLGPVLQNSLPGQTAGTDRQAAPQQEGGAAVPLP